MNNPSQKMMREHIGNYQQNYNKDCNVHFHLGDIWDCLLTTKFSEPLQGAPRERFWPPPGHPWSNVLNFPKNVGATLLPNINDFGATFQYFVNKRQQHDFQNLIINPRKCFLFPIKKPRKSPASVFFLRFGGLPKGYQFKSREFLSFIQVGFSGGV